MNRTALAEVIRTLEPMFDRLAISRSYGGAIAYNYYGPPRLTQDVDVLILVPDVRIPALLDSMSEAGFQHGEIDPQAIRIRAVLEDLRSRAHLATFSYRGTRVEIFVPWHPFHRRVLERSPERDLEGMRIRIHAPEDLVVFKKIFDRPKDLMDIKALLMAQRGKLDHGRLLRDAREFLTEESFAELEGLVRDYG